MDFDIDSFGANDITPENTMPPLYSPERSSPSAPFSDTLSTFITSVTISRNLTSAIKLDHVFKYNESIETLSAKNVSGNPICVKITASLFSVTNDVINAGSSGVISTRFTLFDFTSSNSSLVNPVLYARSMYV